MDDLKLERLFVIYPGNVPFPLHEHVEALPLSQMHKRLEQLGLGTTRPRARKKAARRK